MSSPSLDQLKDELEVRSLLTRERWYRDSCQFEKLRGCYHSDATKTKINISWCTGDIDEFVAGSKAMAEKGIRGIHNISPAEIHFNGDKAFSESLGSIQNCFEVNGIMYEMSSNLVFLSRLERTSGSWKILTFEAIYEYEKVIPLKPSANATLDIPTTGRPSYSTLAWMLAKAGYTIGQSHPGRDRPDLVEKCMQGHFSWLKEN